MADAAGDAGRERVREGARRSRRRGWRRWLRPPRQLRFTREGKWFVAITLGLGVAAVNTGNNLLFLLLGMMLSLIVVSGILSEATLRALVVERRLPSRVHAGAPFLVGVTLRNPKRRLASFSVQVEDLVEEGPPLGKRCYFLKVPAGRTQETAYRHQVAHRGAHRLRGFRLGTTFPFGLFHKSLELDVPGELLVLPRLVETAELAPRSESPAGDEGSSRRGRRGEFLGLREWREGDDRRDVHWRSTARAGRPMVREHEQEHRRRIAILLDNGRPEAIDGPAFERAVSLAASLAVRYLRRGYVVRLDTRGAGIPPAAGAAQELRVLAFLARVGPVDGGAPLASELRGATRLHVTATGSLAA